MLTTLISYRPSAPASPASIPSPLLQVGAPPTNVYMLLATLAQATQSSFGWVAWQVDPRSLPPAPLPSLAMAPHLWLYEVELGVDALGQVGVIRAEAGFAARGAARIVVHGERGGDAMLQLRVVHGYDCCADADAGSDKCGDDDDGDNDKPIPRSLPGRGAA